MDKVNLDKWLGPLFFLAFCLVVLLFAPAIFSGHHETWSPGDATVLASNRPGGRFIGDDTYRICLDSRWVEYRADGRIVHIPVECWK